MTKIDVNKVAKEVQRRKEFMTKDEAKKSLQSAGILDKNGRVAAPYREVFIKA